MASLREFIVGSMAQSRSVPTLGPEVAAYLAGLIDGEGTITLSSLHRSEHRRLVVSISNTVSGRQALALLSQIARHLKTYRALRAEMAIDRYVALTPRNGRYRSETLRLRREFEQAFLAIGPGPRSGRKRS